MCINYGMRRLLTPRQLEVKSRALLGWTWGERRVTDVTVHTRLVTEYGIYYGGIDSFGITERSRALTPLMANVAEKQALSMACPAVVVDFDRPDSQRLLFKGIDASTTPTTGEGEIRSKLIELHQNFLGESLEIGDVELEASYQLLLETWQERLGNNEQRLPFNYPDEECYFYLDEHYADGGIKSRSEDESGMLNTWTSVLIYLMTDFDYLHE